MPTRPQSPPSSQASPRMRLREEYPRWPVRVVGVQDPAPLVRRLTLESRELRGFRRMGADEYFGLVMPRAGVPLHLPRGRGADFRSEVAALPEDVRPGLRWYTVRAHRAAAGQVDVDIVVHREGPGGELLARVRPGDELGFVVGTGGYRADDHAGPQVLVADETAYPALTAIGEEVARHGRAGGVRAYVEAPGPGSLARVDLPFPATYAWRGDASPGTAVIPLLDDAAEPVPAYAWCCGEAGLATGARRRLVELGVPKSVIFFSGYWRLGQARP